MIIAFLGNATSMPAPSSQWYRYKHIVRRLFYSDAAVLSSGALVTTQNIPLPPSESHRSMCRTELLRLSALIRSGALDPLPEQDGILTSLIQKSLSLQADSYRHNANGAAANMTVTALGEGSRKAILQKIWESSDVAAVGTLLVDVELQVLKEVSDKESLPTEEGNGILRACVTLTMAWMGRLPGDKKARWIRLRKDLDKLVTSLMEKSDAIDSSGGMLGSRANGDSATDGVESAFEAAFGDGGFGSSKNLQAGPGASAAFYRQSASLLLVSSSLFAAKRTVRPQESAQVVDEAFVKRIWNMLSNDDMRKHQIYIQNGRLDQEPAVPDDFFRSVAATKVMSILTLLYLGAENKSESVPSASAEEACLSFAISCIVSSLESLCYFFRRQVTRNTEVKLFPATADSTDVSFRPTSTMCIAAISSGFTALSTILTRTRANSSTSSSGDTTPSGQLGNSCLFMTIPVIEIALACIVQVREADEGSELYLRSVLATLRNCIGLFHEAKKNVGTASATALTSFSVDATAASPQTGQKISNESPVDDMFGGLGDDAFMNIDLDNLTNRSNQSTSLPSSQIEADDPKVEDNDAKMDELAKGKLWSLLLDALDAAKVSIAFACTFVSTKPILGGPGHLIMQPLFPLLSFCNYNPLAIAKICHRFQDIAESIFGCSEHYWKGSHCCQCRCDLFKHGCSHFLENAKFRPLHAVV